MTSAGAPAGRLAGSGSSTELHSTAAPFLATSQFEHKIGQITLADGRKMDVFILLKNETGAEMHFPTNFKHKVKIEKLCKKIIDELDPPAGAHKITLSNAGLQYNDSTDAIQNRNYNAEDGSKGNRHSSYWWDKTIDVIKNNKKKGFGRTTF